jgi:serine/threonine protein phosphatase PrpC
MASTIIVLLVHGNSYQISWVGDSRAYLWSPNDRVSPLTQISKDQSLVQKLLDEKVITAAEAINHPRKNLVLQALGQVGLTALEVDSISGKFCDGQQLLLCSDGLNDYVSEADITALLKADVSVDTKVDSLVDLALKNMGKDNITVILVDLNQDNLHTTQQVEQVVVPTRKANIIASNQRSQNPLMAMLIPVTVILLLLGIWFLS